MGDLQCKNCQHFKQHYIRIGRRYGWVNCGHCVYPLLKHRKPNTIACVHYKEREKT